MTDASMRYIQMVADVDTMRQSVHLGQYRRCMQLVYGERVRMMGKWIILHIAAAPVQTLKANLSEGP